MTTRPAKSRTVQFVLGVVALIAELCLVVGTLTGFYVVWDVWWTDVVATKAADAAVQDVTSSPAWHKASMAAEPRRGVGDPPVDYDFTNAQHTAFLGVLHVPRWGDGYARGVYEGTDRPGVLNPLGIGHYMGTPGPGAMGNFALAGHRTTYSKPFWAMDTLRVGDSVVFESKDTWYVYKLTDVGLIIRPNQNEVLAPVFGDTTWSKPATERTITMTACNPKFSARQRIVAHGVLGYWMPKSSGTPIELTGGTK